MLKCSHCVRKLSEYIDGTLGAREAIRLHNHMESCIACREEYEALLRTRDALRSAPVPVARPGFWQHVQQTLRTHPIASVRQPFTLPSLRLLAWGATTAVLLLLVSVLRFTQAPATQSDGKTRIAQRAVNEVEGMISMDALIALHARHSAVHPLADAGRLHYLGSVSEQADLQYDGKLDIH